MERAGDRRQAYRGRDYTHLVGAKIWYLVQSCSSALGAAIVSSYRVIVHARLSRPLGTHFTFSVTLRCAVEPAMCRAPCTYIRRSGAKRGQVRSCDNKLHTWHSCQLTAPCCTTVPFLDHFGLRTFSCARTVCVASQSFHGHAAHATKLEPCGAGARVHLSRVRLLTPTGPRLRRDAKYLKTL